MDESSDVFERNVLDYCAQMEKIDFGSIETELGMVHNGDRRIIPFFNDRYIVSRKEIVDESGNRPDYMTFVILAKYILLCPGRSHYDAEWVSFKDFKKATHFTNVNYFSSDTERAIERHFSGKLNELEKACHELGGLRCKLEIAYDLMMQFNALPRISLLLLFNEEDEEFPAKCSVLFQKHAEYYLDPESLAMTGGCLAKKLRSRQ
ncbi:MAG: DUF3786 domain-containing protein [Desulfobacteraceae bacterium]|nr:MAG: DUF3786 domain-containing protein [Desulfobacteraceae bacterium]